MKNFITKLFASLDNHSLGYSGRKLSALAGVLTGIYITVKLLPIDSQLHALYAWLLFSLLCLGIVTIQNVIELKNGNKVINKDEAA
jgi:hypothetical protein